MNELIKKIFLLSKDIRYVALYQNGKLQSFVKQGIDNASASESDKYEELFVNPAMLTLAKQRGEIDCGGMEFILVRYGNFYQFIMPIKGGGHLSVCIDPKIDPLRIGTQIKQLVT